VRAAGIGGVWGRGMGRARLVREVWVGGGAGGAEEGGRVGAGQGLGGGLMEGVGVRGAGGLRVIGG